ncbi:MAG: DNA-binding domain-containing protein [Pseudomonadales bacterium]
MYRWTGCTGGGMSQLEQIQTEFRRHMTDGDEGIVQRIQSIGQISPAERVSIYDNAYFARLIGALATDYKVLGLALGDEEFAALAKAYILAKPSRYFTLRWFGQDLAQFLSEQKGVHAHLMAQLAAFEWAFVNAFVSADVSMRALEKIALVSAEAWPALNFNFHPSLQILEQSWDVLSYWRAGRAEEDLPDPTFFETPQKIIVWRQDLMSRYKSLSLHEAVALEAAVRGLSFSEICESLLAANVDEADVATQAIGFLQDWLADGLISGINN